MRVRGKKDTTARVLGALNRRRGKEGEGKAASNYTRSTQSVLSAVKYVLKLGIEPIDSATGCFPFGKVVEIYGLDQCGKTALAMLGCGSATQGNIFEVLDDGSLKPIDVPFEVTVLYLDNENSLEEGDRLIVYDREVDCIAGECDTIDQIFKDIETACDELSKVQAQDELQKKKDEAEAKKNKSFVVQPVPLQFLVVVVDTVAGTATRDELKQSWDKQDYSRQPKQLREGFRNTIRNLKRQNVCAIFTNQVGDSFKPKMRGPINNRSSLPQESDFVAFGGKALRYYAHLRIFLCRTEYPYKISGGKFPDGYVIHFFIAKNRRKMPQRQGRMVLMFRNAMCQDEVEWAKTIRPQRLSDMLEREHLKGNKKFTIADAEKFFPEHPPGGYSPIWSLLEHLIYMGFIKYSPATKSFTVNFQKYGISSAAVTTDSNQLETLDTGLDSETGDIEIGPRASWPNFYKSHRQELDVLMQRCTEKMFAQCGIDLGEEEPDASDDPPDEIG
jgi:RecA/RadA recombinase